MRDDAIVRRTPVAGGYTHARREILEYRSGLRVFAKTATDALTAEWLRKEHAMYEALGAQPFLAKYLDWRDGPLPTLVLEDLSHGRWPVDWKPGDVSRVMQTLHQVSQTAPPAHLEPLPPQDLLYDGWSRVASDPDAFLALRVCSVGWFERNIDRLIAHQRAHRSDPMRALIHQDVRSDNLCFLPERTLLIDWNWAALGDPRLDVGFWLPSLHAQGGPAPHEVLPEPGPWPVHITGMWARKASLPALEHAPRVRHVQALQLRWAMPWMQRSMGLPALR